MNDSKVRIFVSSPADVEHERAMVKDIIERLAREFLPYFEIEPILWEEEALTADRTFQAGLVQPSDCEIVLIVLWTRLGSPLPQEPYQGMTGTEWEFFDAVEGTTSGRRPEVLVYKKVNPKLVDITNPQATLEAIEDRKRLEEFFQRNFFNDDQTFRRAFRIFDSDTAFRNLLEVQLRKLLNRRIFVEKRGTGRAFEWHGSPFRPGRPFDFGDERVFTGRESETRDLLRRLQEQVETGHGFLLVSGSSGCGKSSLVRAGLLPRLVRPHQIEGVAACRWCIVDPRKGDGSPLTALVHALCAPEVLGDAFAGFGVEPMLLKRSLEAEPELAVGQVRAALQGLTRAIQADTGETNATARLMVVVDPLEPVFDAADPAPFAAALQALADSGVAWVVAVLRSDHLCHLPRLGKLARLVDPRAWLSLGPPAGARVRQIIEIPSLVVGLAYDSEARRNLVEQLESEAALLNVWPPLLQGALEHLYQEHLESRGGESKQPQGSGSPGIAGLRAGGGLAAEALRRADGLWSHLDEEARCALPRLCRALISLEPASGTLPVVRSGDLDTLEATPDCRRLVHALIEARLVSVEGVRDPALLMPCSGADYSLKGLLGRVVRQARDEWRTRLSRSLSADPEEQASDGDSAAESGENRNWRGYRRTAVLVHSALLQSWGPMRDWLAKRENLESLSLRYQISRQAQLWKRTDCNQEYLLGEAGHAAARRFSSAHGAELEPAEAEFLEQSDLHLRFERRRNRLVRATGLVLAVLLLVATGAAFWASDASHKATVNLQRSRLNAADLAIARGNTPRATTLALDAGGWLPLQALQTLSRAFTANRLIALLHEGPPNPEQPLSAAIDERGERAATLDPAVGIRTWRLDHDRFVPDGPPEISEQLFHRVLSAARPTGGMFLAMATEGVWRLPLKAGSEPDYPCGAEPGAAVELSPDGRLLALSHALAPDSYGVCMVDLDHHGSLLFDAAVHTGEVRSLAFSPDSGRLVTASEDGDAKVLDVGTGEVLLTLPPRSGSRRRPIHRAIFGPRGEHIAIASTDDSVWIYGADGTLVRRLAEMKGKQGTKQVHDSDVQDIAITPDGRYLIAADEDGQVVRWGLGEGESNLVLGSHEQTVVQVRISPDGGQALTASLDKTARLWDIDSGRQIAIFSHDGVVTGADFTADGARVATLSAQDGTARLWSKTPISYLSELMPHQDHVVHIQFAPKNEDGRLRLATASFDGNVRIWSFRRQDGKLLPEEPLLLAGHTRQVRRLAFSPAGDRLVSAGYDGTARIWSLSQGRGSDRELCRLDVGKEGASVQVREALFQPLPAGRWVLTASNSPISPLALWDATTCARLEAGEALGSNSSAAQALDVVTAADGVLVAAGSENGHVRVMRENRQGAWELVCDLALHTRPVLDIVFSPDGSLVASASEDRWSRVVNVAGCGGENPKIVDLVGHADTVRSVRFFPDGQRLVTASLDRTARVWGADGKLVQVLTGHDNFVYYAEPSPDGNWILTASRDGTLGFWQSPGPEAPEQASPYLILSSGLKGVPYAVFSPDGRYIGAAYWRNAAQLWRIWADGDSLDADILAALRDVWGPERANLVLVREAERFRQENRLEELRPPDGAGD